MVIYMTYDFCSILCLFSAIKSSKVLLKNINVLIVGEFCIKGEKRHE